MSKTGEDKKAFRKLISGDVMGGASFVKNLPFLLFVAGLMLVYIGYGYYANNLIREMSKEEDRSIQLYSQLQSLLEVYDMESLQSKVAVEMEEKQIFEAKDPPRIVWFK